MNSNVSTIIITDTWLNIAYKMPQHNKNNFSNVFAIYAKKHCDGGALWIEV